MDLKVYEFGFKIDIMQGSKQRVFVLIIAQMLNYFTYAIIGIRVLLGLLPVGYIIQLSSALSQLLTNLPNLIQHVAAIFFQRQILLLISMNSWIYQKKSQ